MKLLLAEDERDLSGALKKMLECSKYEVDVVYNGADALEKLSDYKYDGAIIDIMMPKLDGLSVVKRVREAKNNVPIIILTARAEIDDRVLGLDSGADDYLTKPFSMKELLARIRSITRRNGEVVVSYKVGNMSLDNESFEISTENGKSRLTNKEYNLLEYLIRNKNMILSTEKIMNSVWGYNSDSDISVVWVFISSLRKKMENIGADCKLRAVRGIGYRLEVGE